MNSYRRIFGVLMLTMVTMAVVAQSGTNSPYSQYGFGILSEQGGAANRGMNGLGLGFHSKDQVNIVNPASYSKIDSLTFLFDVGVSGQNTNFKEGLNKVNAKNADFEYAIAGFRAAKNAGISFGLIPFTNVGYDYYNKTYMESDKSSYYTNTYYGSGGIHQAYLGAGWEPIKNFSIGANLSYLWGNLNRSVVNSYSNSYINTLSKYYAYNVNSYKVDLGIQYTHQITKKDFLTLGLTYGLGHKMGADPNCKVISTNPSTAVSDTASYTLKNVLKIPTMYGVGLQWDHDNKLKLGFDYTLQKWGGLEYPEYKVINNNAEYSLSGNMFMDRHKFTFGGEYIPDETKRSLLSRIHYRAGVSYSTPYIKVNGQDGPKEVSASFGFGIPITNTYNNRSLLNISGQWVHSSGNNMIIENTLRINIGITFNERWFMKWKFE